MVGGGSVASIISLSFRRGGKEEKDFERDGISEDKTTSNPSFIRVSSLVFSLLSFLFFL
jgi:hypothetical protein